MSRTYGLVNFISSFGFSARWRHQAVKNVVFTDTSHVFDLMSGMNELCRSVSLRASPNLRLTAVDLSPEMIRRARKDWPFQLNMHLGDVLTWDFIPGSADVVISSFGLKTFDCDQQMQLARCVARLLRTGGTFSFVEISVPQARFLRWPYMFYLEQIIPWIGKLFLGNPSNYRMLGIYTKAFSNSHHFAECLREQGLQVEEVNYFFGCATGVHGVKLH